jgi:hypothetical protein
MIVGAVFVQPQSEYTGKTFSKNFSFTVPSPSASAAHIVAAASALHVAGSVELNVIKTAGSWAEGLQRYQEQKLKPHHQGETHIKGSTSVFRKLGSG